MLTQLAELYQSGAWVNWERLSYTYDMNGNSTSGRCEKWQNGGWHPDKNNFYLVLYSEKVRIYSLFSLYRYVASYTSFNSGIADKSGDNSFLHLYPNPANSKITIEILSSGTNKEEMISIYNIQGQILMLQPLQKGKTEIDISFLNQGVYIVKVFGRDINAAKKIIKE
jgi:hypothetical protein